MEKCTRELLTINCGNFSNFIGSQWFSLQESAFCYKKENDFINYDITHREGKTLNGEITYTPRIISYDLSTNIGCQPEGNLYTVENSNTGEKSTWPHDMTVYKTEPFKNSWTNYLSTRYHPKSLVSFHSENSTTFDSGYEFFANNKHDIEDNIHYFLEECDSIQGILLFVDAYDLFGGLAEKVIEQLSDDLGINTIYSIPVWNCSLPVNNVKEKAILAINSGLSFSNLLLNTTSVLPMGYYKELWPNQSFTNNENLRLQSPFNDIEVASIFASFIDTITLPIRNENSNQTLSTFLQACNRNSTCNLHAGCINLENIAAKKDCSVSPHFYRQISNIDKNIWKIVINRGQSNWDIVKTNIFYHFEKNSQVVNKMLYDVAGSNNKYTLDVSTSLYNGNLTINILKKLVNAIKLVDIRKLSAFSNMEIDNLNETFNHLQSVVDLYNDANFS